MAFRLFYSGILLGRFARNRVVIAAADGRRQLRRLELPLATRAAREQVLAELRYAQLNHRSRRQARRIMARTRRRYPWTAGTYASIASPVGMGNDGKQAYDLATRTWFGTLVGLLVAAGTPWYDPSNPTFLGGAKGDGITDDTAAGNAAIAKANTDWSVLQARRTQPGQYTAPFVVAFFRGDYRLTRRVSTDQKSGGLFLRAGVSLVGFGANLIMDDNAAHIATVATDITPLSPTTATLTADVAIGDYTFTVDSSAGFALNSPVFCRFGDAATTNVETLYWLFGYVAAIPDGTHLTLDRPSGTALSIAGVTNATNKTIRLLAYELRRFMIDGFNFLQGSSGSANVEHNMAISYARDYSYANLTSVDPGSGVDKKQFCENVHGCNLSVYRSVQQLGQATKGRVIASASESCNILIETIYGANLAGSFAYCEFSTRNYRLKNVQAVLTSNPACPANRTLFQSDNGAEMTVENADIAGDLTNTQIESLTNGGIIRWLNVTIDAAVWATAGGILFRNIEGDFVMNGLPAALAGRWRRIDRYSIRMNLLVNTASQQLPYPSGLVRRIMVYASATTGITSTVCKSSAANSVNLVADLVAGQWVDLGLFNTNTGVRWGSAAPVGDGSTTGHAVAFSTDGTLVLGTYVILKVEYFAPPADNSAQVTDDGSSSFSQNLTRDEAQVVTLTDASPVVSDASLGSQFEVTITAARLFSAPTNRRVGQRLVYTIIQGGAGGFAETWNAAFVVTWSDAGNAAGKRSTIEFWDDGTKLNQVGAQSPYA